MLSVIRNQIIQCQKCPLCKTMPVGATPVPGYGNPNAKILLVGEALGADEVLLGEPFVGLAGKYLNKMLKEAGIERHNLYITNTVHCRPTKNDKGQANRPPKPAEIKACKDWMLEEIREIKPAVIMPLGLVACKALLGKYMNVPLDVAAGLKIERPEYSPAIIIPNYHPSYLMGRRKDLTTKAIEIFRKADEWASQ